MKTLAMKRFLPLKPVVSRTESEVLKNKSLLFDLIGAFGSPLNIVLPDQVALNYKNFIKLFEEQNIDGSILYAQKANKSLALLRRLIYEGSGTNNASLNEIQNALANGCAPDITEAGGPKNDEYILHSIFSGLLVNTDSLDELENALKMSRKLSRSARIILRLSGFSAEGVQVLSKPTRFGIDINDLSQALELMKKHKSNIQFEGFSFHLDTVAVSEKKIAMDGLVSAVLKAKEYGFQTRKLDIGGGYKVNYLEDRNEWDEYMTSLRESLLGKQLPVTWQGAGFGLRVNCGVIQGNLNMYSYYDNTVGSDYLKSLLNEKSSHADMTFGEFFAETRIQLVLEPGRALLANAGITLGKVEEVRHTKNGDVLVRLDMNRGDITIQDLELFVDPVVIKANGNNSSETFDDGCYIIGNLCLESDFISRRKVYLPQAPEKGDLIAFVNSAAYISDFNAHSAALQRIAKKVAIYENEQGELEWREDEEYWPTIK